LPQTSTNQTNPTFFHS
jgi:deoxyadenosine/deoxycytidine kinase